ncbi:SDR family NAD(P)-dependent oxidoreductase [Mucilaginibacter sp.]|uniref:SDR family NAD(P)-dependent oxidoreductase n=1 Tax=Mucilaginibacter sp. TaxID=1882438 RepID=UPI003AFFBE56
MNNQEEKIFLITGGTSGVGKAAALGLAQKGAKIVIISREHKAAENVLQEIARRTGNNRGEYLIADLSLQSSVKNVATEFKRKYENLHVLVNCMGAIFNEEKMTSEGIERTFAVNYMSHFWLTTELLDVIKASGASRILTVTGNPSFLKNAKLDFDDLQCVKNFSPLKATQNAMYARLFFAFELAKRLEGTSVSSNAFNPGVIKSNLTANSPWYLKLLALLFKFSEKEVCDVTTYLSTSEDVQGISGKFFQHNRKIVGLEETFNAQIGEALWEGSKKLAFISTK